MRIALITELFPPSTGGQEIRFKELAEHFVTLGHEVHVYTIGHQLHLKTYEVINGVHIHRIIFDDTYIVSGIKGRKTSTIFKFTWALIRAKLKKFDIAIYNQWPLVPAILSNWISGKDCKNCLDFVEFRSGNVYRIIHSILFSSIHKICCISASIQEKVASVKGEKTNLFTIPSLVKTENFYSNSKDYFLFIGRMEKHKHPEHAILCAIEFNKLFPQHRKKLVLIGDGGMYEDLFSTYQNNPDIEFAGFVNDSQKSEIISHAKVLIFPSEREGLPKSVIECLSAGVPTLTTNYIDNGTKDFVHEYKIGRVSEPSIDKLAKELFEIENNYDFYSNNCKQNKLNFDLFSGSQKYIHNIIN